MEVESWDYREPFHITGYTWTCMDIIYVEIHEDGATGRGEAAGVYYFDETGDSMRRDILSVRPAIEAGAGREDLLGLLPAGGARNALDCALWDLEAKLAGKTIWELTGVDPGPLQTVLTVGLDTPDVMAASAKRLASDRLKVKLSGDAPLERIVAVRKARPDADIIVDANQGWSFAQLEELAPKFRELRVAMIEQPLPRGADDGLEGFESPVPLCADESCLDTSEFELAARRYHVINIKLDKTGGLTEALALAKLARRRGLDVMVGNMVGTSLAMAPGCVVAQLCRFVDLDGPCFLVRDREHAIRYDNGALTLPTPALWG